MTTATIAKKSPQSENAKAPNTHKTGSQPVLQLDSKAKKSLQAGRKNLSNDTNYVEAFSFIDNLLTQQ